MGPAGLAHLDAIARWLQDAAFADGIDAGLGTASFWIIRRTSMQVERLPRFAEQLELRTWCGGLAASTAERRTSVSGDLGAALEVEAVWVHIDAETRRPARFTPEFLEVYGESAEGRRPQGALQHPPTPPQGARRVGWEFSQADVDLAGHVNNAVYWRAAEQYLLAEAPGAEGAEARVLEAEYRSGIKAGEATVAQAGSMLWVIDREGAVAGTLSISGDSA